MSSSRPLAALCALIGVVAVLPTLSATAAADPVPAVVAPTSPTPLPAAKDTPGAFVTLTPTRVLDTRSGLGAARSQVRAGQALRLAVTGRAGVPTSGVAAVVLTVTVTGGRTGGHLTAYPSGTTAPLASAMNWRDGERRAGAVTVPVGRDGAVALRPSATTDLFADVAGYVVGGIPSAAGTFVARSPVRLVDTRNGTGGSASPVTATSRTVVLAGRGGIPATGAAGVVATVTVTRPTAVGFLRVWPAGTREPATSAVNFVRGQTVANQVTVRLGDGGAIALRVSGGSADVVVDVTGHHLAGTPTLPGTFVPVAPLRTLAPPSYPSLPTATVNAPEVPIGSAAAAVVNVTVESRRWRGEGHVTLWPDGAPQPRTSVIAFLSDFEDPVSNQATVPLGPGGRIHSTLAVLLDVAGFYLAQPPRPATDVRAETVRAGVTLTWTASPDPDAQYTVRRAAGTTAPATITDGDPVGPAGGTATTVTDTTPPGRTPLSYTVFTHDGFARTPFPTVVGHAGDGTAPAAVTGLRATPRAESVTLDFDVPTDDAIGVVVRGTRGTTAPASPSDGEPVTLDRQSPGTATLRPVASGTTWSFRVFARDAFGNLAPGVAVTTTTLGPTLGTPFAPALPEGAPADAFLDITGVACPADGRCVAVGRERSNSRATARAVLVRQDGERWVTTVTPLPAAAGSGSSGLSAVACPAVDHCTAVGTAGAGALVLRLDGDAVTLVPGGGSVEADGRLPSWRLACLAVDDCVAVGFSGSPTQALRIRTTAQALVATSTPASLRTYDVACAATVCHVLAGVTDPDERVVLGRVDDTGLRWGDALGASGSSMTQLACSPSGRCAAAGSVTVDGTRRPLQALLEGDRWRIGTPPGVTAADWWPVVACLDTACSAVYQGARGAQFTTLGTAAATVHDLPRPEGLLGNTNAYDQLACLDAARCVLSGFPTSFVAGLATVVDGVAAAVQVGRQGGEATAMACAPDGACVQAYLRDRSASAPSQATLVPFTVPR